MRNSKILSVERQNDNLRILIELKILNKTFVVEALAHLKVGYIAVHKARVLKINGKGAGEFGIWQQRSDIIKQGEKDYDEIISFLQNKNNEKFR